MRPHVTASTRTVFRPTLGKRFYARASDAYYARAKQLVMAKYPPELDELDFPGDLDETDFAHVLAYDYDHWQERETVQICLDRETSHRFVWLRAAKRRALFFTYEDDDYQPHGYCRDEDKWRAFVRRVARFLRFVDTKRIEATW